MAIQKREVEFAKEADDVILLVIELVKNRKEQAPITDLLDELMSAIGGIGDVTAEASEHRKVLLQTIGYRAGELADAFIGA